MSKGGSEDTQRLLDLDSGLGCERSPTPFSLPMSGEKLYFQLIGGHLQDGPQVLTGPSLWHDDLCGPTRLALGLQVTQSLGNLRCCLAVQQPGPAVSPGPRGAEIPRADFSPS